MIQVHVEDEFYVNALKIHVFERRGEFVTIYGGDGISRVERVPEAAHMPTYPIVLPRNAASPLLAALSRHLGAVEHPEQLRKDYEHERGRVDRLINAIIEGKA